MPKKTTLIIFLTGFAILAAIALAGYLLSFSEWPGGIRPNYAAPDYDDRLTRDAATAKPLIIAINRYHDDHAGFPAHVTDFISYLSSPPAPPLSPGVDEILGWHYYQGENGIGYRLSRKLGWDPSLHYDNNGSHARWVFEPGDGSPEKTLILRP